MASGVLSLKFVEELFVGLYQGTTGVPSGSRSEKFAS